MSNVIGSIIEIGMNNQEAVEKTKQLGKALQDAQKQGSAAIDTLEQRLQRHGQTVEQLNQELVNSAKRTSEQQIKINEERIKKQIDLEKQREQTQKTRASGFVDVEEKRRLRELEVTSLKTAGRIAGQRERTITNIETAEQRRKTAAFKQDLNERTRYVQQYNRVLERAASVSEGVREKAFGAIGGATMHRRRDALMGFTGMTNREAISSQLSSVFSLDESLFLSGMASTRPVSFGGRDVEGERARRQADAEEQRYLKEEREAKRRLRREEALETRRERLAQASIDRQVAAADRFRTLNPNFANMRGGGGRGGGNVITRLLGMGGGGAMGGLAANIAGGLGIGIGAYGAVNIANQLTEMNELATAYDRQLVAARNLAGGQERLNTLLESYREASGGAVDQTTELANVTRLLSTGFANTGPEVERFVRATRGASIALGKPQDYVIQETQLAISNISVKRLDQIGLGIEEVNQRIKELRESNAGWTREMAFQDAVLSLMEEKYGGLTETIEGQATGLEKLRKAWKDLRLETGQQTQGQLEGFFSGLSGIVDPNSALNQRIQRGTEIRDRQLWDILDATGLSALERLRTGKTQAQMNAERVLQNPGAMGWPTGAPRGDMPGDIPRNVRPLSWRESMGEDRMAVIDAGYEQALEIEKQYQRARLDAIEQYEQSRASLVNNFNKQMAREEEDFLRQRARSLRDYERAILDVMRDAQEREAEWQEDLDEKIADLKEDGNEKIAEMEEKYQEDREKSERQHRQRLLKAAGQLDAIAVLEERQRYREENKEREEAHREAIEEQREALQEQIDEAMEAHQERLEDAREADAKRLQDMATARERQLADENEDREIRKNRAIEDHNDQLEEMDRQHGITMQKLEEQAEEERQALQDALEKDLAAVGVYLEGYMDKVKAKDRLIEVWYEKFVDKLEKSIKEELAGDPQVGRAELYERVAPLDSFARGGRVPQTGPAMLHAGEYVLSRDMLASGWSPTGDSSYNNSRSIIIQSGAISVQTTPGYEHLVGDIVEQKLIDLLEAV